MAGRCGIRMLDRKTNGGEETSQGKEELRAKVELVNDCFSRTGKKRRARRWNA